MVEVANQINQVAEFTRINNTVMSEIDHMSQVSPVTTNIVGNNMMGSLNSQTHRNVPAWAKGLICIFQYISWSSPWFKPAFRKPEKILELEYISVRTALGTVV